MSDLLLNGETLVMDADLTLPHEGRWVGDVQADLDAPTSGAVVLTLLGQDYHGTIVPADDAGAELAGRVRLRIVGGTGGLDTVLDPTQYSHGPTVSEILQDLLGRAGETLSSTTDTDLLARVLPAWAHARAPAIDVVGQLATQLGVLWRVLADGTVWLGTDAWQPVQGVDWTLISGTPEAGRLVIAVDDCPVMPGDALDGLHVRQLLHAVHGRAARTMLVLDDSCSPFTRLVDRWLRRRGWDWSRPQPGKLVQQDEDGTLQVQLDNSDLDAIRGVQIRPGLPETTIKIEPGARVLVEWESGDPGAPVVTAWGQSSIQEIDIGPSAKPSARQGDAVGYLNYTQAFIGPAPVVSAISWGDTATGVPVPAGAPVAGNYSIPITITAGSSLVKVGG